MNQILTMMTTPDLIQAKALLYSSSIPVNWPMRILIPLQRLPGASKWQLSDPHSWPIKAKQKPRRRKSLGKSRKTPQHPMHESLTCHPDKAHQWLPPATLEEPEVLSPILAPLPKYTIMAMKDTAATFPQNPQFPFALRFPCFNMLGKPVSSMIRCSTRMMTISIGTSNSTTNDDFTY